MNGARADNDEKALLVQRCHDLEAAVAGREEDLGRVRSDLTRINTDTQSRMKILSSEKFDAEAAAVETRRDQEALFKEKALLVQRCHDLEAAVAGREEDLGRVRSDLTHINTDMQSRVEILSSEKFDAEAAVVETRRNQGAFLKEKAHVEMRCRKVDAEAASKTEEAGARAGGVTRADTVRKGELAREVSAAPAPVPAKPIGIENKGNQCSLNAVVQLLRHFAPFREEIIALKAAQTLPQGPTIGIPPEAAKGVIASTTKSRRQKNGGMSSKGRVRLRRASNLEEILESATWGEPSGRSGGRVGGPCQVTRRSLDRGWETRDIPNQKRLVSGSDGAPHGRGRIHHERLPREAPGKGASTYDGSLAPQKLFVQLMRMSWGAGTGCKVKTLVNFPEVLDISLYSGEPGVYDLDGVIHHVETGASRDLASTSYRGHFLTFVRTGGQCWRKFDDVEISSATLAEVVTADAYILSYTRRCS